MNFFRKNYRSLTAILLAGLLTVITACSSGSTRVDRTGELPQTAETAIYPALERGNTTEGQNFGQWVVQTARGLVSDAYVRDNNKLGVVISPQVKPKEVRSLASSLAQGFHNSFPGQDLTVLVYAPDKELIMTAEYDHQANVVTYNAA